MCGLCRICEILMSGNFSCVEQVKHAEYMEHNMLKFKLCVVGGA